MLGHRKHASIGGRIAAVEPGSIGAEIGIEPGDVLVSINGHPLRDVIEYQFYGAEEELVLQIERGGRPHRIEVEREYDESLGLGFAEPLFDGLRQCANRCPFCFVAQLPHAMRRSLYLRDDDYRLSFLHGSYVTLTNLDEDDWQRIGEQHLSPLYVSVHATDRKVRRALLGNARAPDIIPQLQRLGRMNIVVHAQAVIVPGANDGAVLEETVKALLDLWPTVQTLALVPVGLTRQCAEHLSTLSDGDAQSILTLAEQLAPAIRARTRRTWLYPSDELYLLAGQEAPLAETYDDSAQYENGVGLVRALLDDWAFARGQVNRAMFQGIRATLVCGTLIAPTLQRLASEASQITGARLCVLPVANRFFGPTVTVSGLLTGADVLGALKARSASDVVCIPRAMLDESGERTLDDITIESMAQELDTPVEPVSNLSDVLDLLYSLGA
jgi:putative radical SAM enzyme (TIGR03279 family)